MFRSSEGGGGIGVRSVTTTTRPSIEEYDVSIRILGSFRNRNLRPLPEIGEVSPPEQGGGEEFAATPPPLLLLSRRRRGRRSKMRSRGRPFGQPTSNSPPRRYRFPLPRRRRRHRNRHCIGRSSEGTNPQNPSEERPLRNSFILLLILLLLLLLQTPG